MKAIKILFLFFFVSSIKVYGQVIPSDSISREEFNQFIQNANQDFNQFKAQAHADFERFLEEAWTEFQCFTGERSYYPIPKPSELPSLEIHTGNHFDADTKPTFDVTVIPDRDGDNDTSFPQDSGLGFNTIGFYGKTLGFHLPESLKIKAKSLREKDVAAYYKTMSSRFEVRLLHQELVSTMKQLGLNPWGYYLLLRALSEKTFTDINDRVLFCFFMLHHNGFKARVGRGQQSGQLLLLLAIDNSKEVYSLPFFRINNVKYYAVYGGNRGENAYSYKEKADEKGLRQIGLDFSQPLRIGACDRERKLKFPKANMEIKLPYSTSNLRYYDDLPLTVFSVYAKTDLSSGAQDLIRSTINDMRSRMSTIQVAEALLNFVQTSFAYKIDEEQFGHEKYFFPEEVIGYPFSDCEDRCALFAWLMRTYLGCDVVGVLYNDHLATAVHFDDDLSVPGSSFEYHGSRYVICDPTYPNASVGMVMPKYENKKYEIVIVR